MKKYEQIAQDLSVLIDQKKPGEQIATERELAADYGVSPMTVRRALQLLSAAGRIEGVQGRGTFVRLPKVTRSLGPNSFSATMRAAGRTPGAILVSTSMGAPSQEEAERLECARDEQVVRVKRVRTADGLPIGVETAVLLAVRFPGLLGFDLEQSLYALLQRKYDTRVSASGFTVAAVLPGQEDAELLGIDSGFPCLATQNMSRDDEGVMLEFTSAVYRGDRYHVSLGEGAGTVGA